MLRGSPRQLLGISGHLEAFLSMIHVTLTTTPIRFGRPHFIGEETEALRSQSLESIKVAESGFVSGSLDAVLFLALKILESLPARGPEPPEQYLGLPRRGANLREATRCFWPCPAHSPISPTDPSTLSGIEEPGEIAHPLPVNLTPPPLPTPFFQPPQSLTQAPSPA